MSSKKQIVRLVKNHSVFNAGERAGFAPDYAHALVKAGVAVFDGKDDEFEGLSRTDLVAIAKLRFGIQEEPPVDMSDEDLREALREHKRKTGDAAFQSGNFPGDHPSQGNDAGDGLDLIGANTGKPVSAKRVSGTLKMPVKAGDQLEAMERPQLEAFAKSKCGFKEIDPELTDVELREQIRATAAEKLKK